MVCGVIVNMSATRMCITEGGHAHGLSTLLFGNSGRAVVKGNSRHSLIVKLYDALNEARHLTSLN